MEHTSTRISDKAPQICDWFKDGKPITQITVLIKDEYGIDTSYQAVHRILKKNNLSRQDGGKHKQTSEKRKEATEQKQQNLNDRYGCTEEQWTVLRGTAEQYKDTPIAAYNTFKNNFKNLYKEIPFELPLWDWWMMWELSEKWGQHKRNPNGMFVMTFVDKTKPLTKENARIMAFSDLLKEQRAPKTEVQ